MSAWTKGAPVLWVTEPVEVWLEGDAVRFRIVSGCEPFEFGCGKATFFKGMANCADLLEGARSAIVLDFAEARAASPLPLRVVGEEL